MKKIFSLTILVSISYFSFAQTIKTDVLVVGNNTPAISAAIQAARSGVQTILMDSGTIGNTLSQQELLILKKNPKDIRKSSKKDSIASLSGTILLKNITDTIKNLTVFNNSISNSIEKSGKGWEIKYTGGKIKAQFVIDGTANMTLTSAISLQNGKPILKYKTIVPYSLSANEALQNKLYRTIAATADIRTNVIPIGAMLPYGVENFIVLSNYPSTLKPDAIFYGQAAGGIAAFCSFFKTTTKSLDIRVTQGELLGYGSVLIPFKDVAVADSNFMSLQHIALTGIIKVDNKLNFNPDNTISAAEIKAAMKEYYSRSQIWFFKFNPEELTINDAITLIKITATRGNELNTEIEKGWKSSLKLKSDFNIKRPITRREFAVLLDTYLKPFTVRVDLNGNLLN